MRGLLLMITEIKKIGKAMKGVSLLLRFPNINYGDAIHDQPSNVSFSSKNKSHQYYIALIITGVIRGLSREKLYH